LVAAASRTNINILHRDAFRHRGVAAVFRLHTDIWLYFEQATEQLIREAIHAIPISSQHEPDCNGGLSREPMTLVVALAHLRKSFA
jgi:hypothetical protein